MKTFKDLIFKEHPSVPFFMKQARMDFDNGYGISVVNGQSAYSSEGTYEIAVMKGGQITYDTHITNDVIGYLLPEEVTEVMKDIQELR
jgi:hypothetical protein